MPEDNSPQYDVIYDGGTLEHIFNAPQALKTIHGLLKQDGIIVHGSPSHNHVDHGFYMFSPTFFWDYYSANKYNILTSYLFQYSSPDNCTWEVFEYQPGSLDDFSFGGFGKKMVGIWFIAQKTSKSSNNIFPQQGACIEMWKTEGATLVNPKKINSFRKWLKGFKTLRLFVRGARTLRNKTPFIAKKPKLKKVKSI